MKGNSFSGNGNRFSSSYSLTDYEEEEEEVET